MKRTKNDYDQPPGDMDGAQVSAADEAGEPHEAAPSQPERPPRERRPKEAELNPSPRELGKEHRGY